MLLKKKMDWMKRSFVDISWILQIIIYWTAVLGACEKWHKMLQQKYGMIVDNSVSTLKHDVLFC